LRDAALDLGDDALALSAQHQLLGLAPFDAIEWRCMGDMLATARDAIGATAAYAYSARIAPSDAQTEAHLAAVQAGNFDSFAVTGGFATPRPRQLIRFARRAA
jgi:predicted TPR repeat methyltransferase